MSVTADSRIQEGIAALTPGLVSDLAFPRNFPGTTMLFNSSVPCGCPGQPVVQRNNFPS